MRITLKRVNENVHFEALNETGNTVQIDGTPSIGGENAGFRPMELALAALAGCVSMDLVSILKKQRQDLREVGIEVTGDRKPDGDVRPFTRIHLLYRLYGTIDPGRAEKALELAVTKYCSVGEMLKATVEITYDLEILP